MRNRRQSTEQQQIISRRLAAVSTRLGEGTPSDLPDDEPLTPVVRIAQPEHQWPPIDSELALAFRPWDPPVLSTYDVEMRAEPVGLTTPQRPGRHAARRRSALLSGKLSQRVPTRLRSAYPLGPAQVSVIALLVAVGLIATAWWAIASRPHTSTPTVSAATTEASPEALIEVEPAAVEAADLIVDVSGKVRRPGIAVLAPGSRVVDAIEAAGGARRGVDLGLLNLARPLVDGEQILVGVPQPAGVGAAAAAPPASETTATPIALVNINTAGQVELETLPGVGPVTALAIISWRSEHNGFGAVEELLDVQGIGEATLAELAPHVTV